MGAAHLTTDWLCFLDADDLWHPEHLKLLVDHSFAIPEARVLSAGTVRFSTEPLVNALTAPPIDAPDRRAPSPVPPQLIPDPADIPDRPSQPSGRRAMDHRTPPFLPGESHLLRRANHRSTTIPRCRRLPISLPTAEDFGFWLAVSLLGPVHATPDATFFVRVAEASMTTRTNLGLGHIAATLPFLVGADLARNPELVEEVLDNPDAWMPMLWVASRSAMVRQRPLERRVVSMLARFLIRSPRRRSKFQLAALIAQDEISLSRTKNP